MPPTLKLALSPDGTHIFYITQNVKRATKAFCPGDGQLGGQSTRGHRRRWWTFLLGGWAVDRVLCFWERSMENFGAFILGHLRRRAVEVRCAAMDCTHPCCSFCGLLIGR